MSLKTNQECFCYELGAYHWEKSEEEKDLGALAHQEISTNCRSDAAMKRMPRVTYFSRGEYSFISTSKLEDDLRVAFLNSWKGVDQGALGSFHPLILMPLYKAQ